MKTKKITIPRATVIALLPNFSKKIISREVTLALAGDGTVVLEPGKLEDFKAELSEAFESRLEQVNNLTAEQEGANAFLYRVCFGEWPEGYEDAERLAELEHSHNIRGVEIFATGTWNGDEYTEKDLDDMVAAFKALDYRPALKVGHTKDKPGDPAYGWVTNLRKVGGKLVADFESMHASVITALRDKRYDRVSSEIYFNFKRGADTFRRALKAVALLGAEVPAVAKLVPLHKIEFSAEGFEKATACEQALDVSPQAVIDGLTEHVATLTELISSEKELSMKTVAQIKKELADLNAKLATLKSADKKDDAEIKKCSDAIAALSADVKSLEDAEAAKTENTELKARLAKLEEQDRARKLKAAVDAIKIPAFRPAFQGLYAHAFAQADSVKVAVYNAETKKDEDKSLAEALDGVVAALNTAADQKLFTTFSSKGGRQERQEVPSAADGEAAGAELDKLVLEYQRKNPTVKDYAVALESVMADNPALAKQYTDSQGRGN